jgi:acyl carrier protein
MTAFGDGCRLVSEPVVVGSDRDGGRPKYRNRFVPRATSVLSWEGNRVSTIVEEKVIGIVSEQLGVPKEEVKLESSIIEDLKADSLDVVELVMELEDEFDITIPDDDYEKLKTVGDAIKYIDEKK